MNEIETQEASHRLTELHPFSEYTVDLWALLDDNKVVKKSLDFITPSAVPGSSPEPVEEGSKSTSSYIQALKFFWREPSDCFSRNGRAAGYRVELFGVDKWVHADKPIKIDGVREGVNSFYAQGLMSFTTYRLDVYAKNEGGIWNPAKALQLTARTLPTTPEPPVDIRVSPGATSVHVHWIEHYPPTGKVENFFLRVRKSQNKDVWRYRVRVPGRDRCIAGEDERTHEEPICTVIADLDPDTAYTLEIQTKNVDVNKPSMFSQSVDFFTDPVSFAPQVNLSFTTPEPVDEAHENTSKDDDEVILDPLVIVMILVTTALILIVVSTVLVYKIKVNKLKMHYEQQQQQRSANYTDSTFMSTTSTRTSSFFEPGTWTSRHVDEIQSRRLPEPPPSVSDSYYVDADASQYTDVAGCTDVDGYLKPTFGQESSAAAGDFNQRLPAPSNVIPVESYVAPNDVRRDTVAASVLRATEAAATAFDASVASASTMQFDLSSTSSSSIPGTMKISESYPLVLNKSVNV